jgi:Ca2+-binding RTX toxin-like protein
MRAGSGRSFLATCTTAGVLLAGAGGASAATITPTATGDEHTAGGICSLREAIASANANADTLGCTHTGTYGDDTISLPGTSYGLTIGGSGENADATGDLDITNSSTLAIVHPGTGQAAIDASGLAPRDRVIDQLPGTALSLSAIAVQGGMITGEAGGGIRTTGDSTTLVNSTVEGNSSNFNGGGLFGPNLTLVQSTVSGNSSGSYGGGINASVLTMTSSTVSANVAAGGGTEIALQTGASVIESSTVAGDTSISSFFLPSVAPTNSLTMRNSILATIDGGTGAACDGNPGASLISSGHNLVGGDCPRNAGAGDIGGDPRLAGFAANGGPTQTRALLTGSPAIDAGADCPGTDQRGIIRPQGPACDIGAFEVTVPASPPTCAGRTATIAGTSANDKLKGTKGRDVIAALGGNDKVKGLKGNDLICGGDGRDKIHGGAGRDRLLGEAGKDLLIGGPDKDRLRGGPGKDLAKQ